MRLIASASSVRLEGSYPCIRIQGSLAGPQPSELHFQPDAAYRRPGGPADADPSASQQSQQDDAAVRPPRSRPSSRRSIGGAALRVPRPDAPGAAAARPAAAMNVLALPDVAGDQAAFSGRPPKPQRTSSLSLPSGRGSSASGAVRMQTDQPVVRRTSTLSGSTHERALTRRA